MAAQRSIPSRRIVVDTNVARSASETSFPQSVACRQVLETILTVCHRVVLSPSQKAEWQRHQSRYTLRWLASMTARGKQFLLPEDPDTGLREAIDRAAPVEWSREELFKDVYLLESALATDGIVVSLEKRAAKHYRPLVAAVPQIGPIAWVHPLEPPDQCRKWLTEGAPTRPAFCLTPPIGKGKK